MITLAFFFLAPFLAPLALGLTAASTAVGVYSHLQAGKAAKATGKANADLARTEALRKESLSRENIRRTREMNRRHLSTQKAQFAASGVQLRGTPLAVMGQTASNLELEVFDMAFQASEQSRKLQQEARMSIFEGNQANKAAKMKAGASLLSGLTSMVGGYTSGKDTGAIKSK